MNVPNKLTLLRIALIPVFLIFFFVEMKVFNVDIGRSIALAIFIIASLTDFFDGFIARRYDSITEFGIIMDPIADKLLICAAFVALVQTHEVEAWVTIIIISREFLITGFRMIAASQNNILASGILGKGKTVFQMLTVVFILSKFTFNGAELIAKALIFLTVISTVISAIEIVVKNRKVLGKIKF